MGSKRIFKYLVSLLLIMSLHSSVFANQILKDAWHFLETPGASIEDNQQYITQSNQFSAEVDFSAEEYAEWLLIRGLIYSRLKDTENALENYSSALLSGKLSPILKAEAYKNRGLLYYTSTVYQEAKDDFVNALDILSGNAELHYYLANAYFGLFDFQTALNQYDLALEGMSNNRFLAFYGKASVYHQQKIFDKSRVNLIKSLEINPNFEPATTLLNEIDNANSTTLTLQNEDVNTAELTAAQIYNQLLEKAFAAQKSGDGSKKISIKLDLDALQTVPQTQTSSAIRISATPSKDFSQNFSGQASAIPFLIENTDQPTRLDNLLVEKPVIAAAQYSLQLYSAENEKSAQIYYQNMLKKHQLLLANRPHSIKPFTNKDQKTNYQLFVSGFASYKQANSLCKFLKAQNSQCFVRQMK